AVVADDDVTQNGDSRGLRVDLYDSRVSRRGKRVLRPDTPVPVGQHQRIGVRVPVVVRHLQARFEALRNERLVAVGDLAELGEADRPGRVGPAGDDAVLY